MPAASCWTSGRWSSTCRPPTPRRSNGRCGESAGATSRAVRPWCEHSAPRHARLGAGAERHSAERGRRSAKREARSEERGMRKHPKSRAGCARQHAGQSVGHPPPLWAAEGRQPDLCGCVLCASACWQGPSRAAAQRKNAKRSQFWQSVGQNTRSVWHSGYGQLPADMAVAAAGKTKPILGSIAATGPGGFFAKRSQFRRRCATW